jgi:nucleoside phosphorylase
MDLSGQRHGDYTVGWICALQQELTAARAMLDEIHADLSLSNDSNSYCLGRIGDHNIAIACPAKGDIGNHAAATVATRMLSTFKSIRFGLLVGVGSGVPSDNHNIHLGDVVVSAPTERHGGVVQWDYGKTTKGGRFERSGALNRPPTVLMTALTKLESTHEMEDSKVLEYASEMVARYPKLISKFTLRPSMDDILFDAEYDHIDSNDTCHDCDTSRIVFRSPRSVDFAIHYGLIASGSQAMMNGLKRDEISKDLGGVLCFEMEAAGLMNGFPCLVIRGICDYADSHRNKQWQGYAAATAAAFAKELLNNIARTEVVITRTALEAMKELLGQVAESTKRVERKVLSMKH